MNVQTMIYVIFAGICCALIYSYYTKKFLGSLIRKLHEKKINKVEESQTLRELGYGSISAFLLLVSLGENSSLMKYVKGRYTADELTVLKEKGVRQQYYLPEDTEEIALKRYDDSNMKLWKLLCGILACVVAAVICINVFPYLISMTEGRLGGSDDKNEVIGTTVEETVRTEVTE
ncbi:MAG: hypothetical protein E7583_07950 [Ruminococcaceae bacterium]|nr:hypothetical protein [Oscillospiraceae bacterium]